MTIKNIHKITVISMRALSKSLKMLYCYITKLLIFNISSNIKFIFLYTLDKMKAYVAHAILFI